MRSPLGGLGGLSAGASPVPERTVVTPGGAAPEDECELESRSAQPGHQPQGISQAQQPPPPDWTMLGQDSSAPPLQTQSWTRVLREAPEWSRRLQVRADQTAEQLTGQALVCEPQPTKGPQSRRRARGGQETRAGRPHRTSRGLQSCNPAAARSGRRTPRLPLPPWGRHPSAQRAGRGCSRQRAPRKPERRLLEAELLPLLPRDLDTLLHPAPSRGMSHFSDLAHPQLFLILRVTASSRISRTSKEGESFWGSG